MIDSIIYRYIIGVDISKQWLDIYLFDSKNKTGLQTQVSNSKDGFDRLGQWLEDYNIDKTQAIICSEHTGRYGEHLLAWTTRRGWKHALLKTTALQKVSREHHRKTDRYDAKKIAEYGYRFHDKLTFKKAPSPALKQIKRLRRERKEMVGRRAGVRQKLTEAGYHEADMQEFIACWKQQEALLSKHIEEFEQRIKTLINEDDYLAEEYRRMRTAPGIGKVIAPAWLSMFAGTARLDPRKLSSRFGFAPHPRQSGSSVKKYARSSGFGNRTFRGLMHQAARSVTTHHAHYRDYYQRKLAEGKSELLVINNVINKLIRLYCAMWNNKVVYDPDYIENYENQKNAA